MIKEVPKQGEPQKTMTDFMRHVYDQSKFL